MLDPHKITTLHAIRDAHPGTGGTVQCDRIRAALALYPVTTFEAMRHLDVYDPRARVLQLRRAGVAIDTHWKDLQNPPSDSNYPPHEAKKRCAHHPKRQEDQGIEIRTSYLPV